VRPPARIRAARNETPRIIFAYGLSRNFGDGFDEIEDGGSIKGVVSSGSLDVVDIMEMKAKLKVDEIENHGQRWGCSLWNISRLRRSGDTRISKWARLE
jgi:hypothetical protein